MAVFLDPNLWTLCKLFLFTVALSSCYCFTDEDPDLLDKKWSKYHQQIQDSLDHYIECERDNDGCSTCYDSQIAADLKPWADGITQDMLGIASTRAVAYQIINHQLYRSEKCVFEARCQGVEHFIKALLPELPDMELRMNHFDYPASPANYRKLSPVFSFSKDSTYADIMYPAWTFHSGGPAVWPIYPTGQGDWEGTRDWLIDVAKTRYPWEKKENRGFFIGSRTTDERDPLILLSRAKPDLVEAAYTKNQAYKGPQDTLNADPVAPKKYDEHCAFKYLFNFRGVAASFRFKHLFLCDSLVFHVGDEWLEFFYPAMKPWVHYIPVPVDLSNVQELLEFAKENDATAKQIADRGSKFIREHLRQKDIFCYWKKMLIAYSKLLKFKPKLDSSLKYIYG